LTAQTSLAPLVVSSGNGAVLEKLL
jgi:hypothetical protein